MTELEQKAHLGNLLVEERRAKKELACLTSKARQLHDALVPALSALQQPYCADFDFLRSMYEPVAGVDVGGLISSIEKALTRTGVLQKEIKAIEQTGV